MFLGFVCGKVPTPENKLSENLKITGGGRNEVGTFITALFCETGPKAMKRGMGAGTGQAPEVSKATRAGKALVYGAATWSRTAQS